MNSIAEQIGRLGLDSTTEDILVECSKSTRVIAKTLFPDRFHAEFSPLHDQIFDIIDSGLPRVAIAAPRGIGKTSIVALALAARKMLFHLCHFYVYVSNSATSGELQTENLKFELASNKIIKKLFGDVKTKGVEGIDETFSKKAWVALSNCLVLPRGSGQQVRGILYHNWRPDLIVIDDLENTESVENEELRKKEWIWFNADLMKCVSRVSNDWQIVYIDTLKHEDAILQKLLDSPSWESIRLEICDDDLNPTAPGFMSRETIEIEHAYHKKEGILDVFYREFRNMPISSEDAVFRPEYFHHYEEPDLMAPKEGKAVPNLTNVVIVDPAKTVKLHSAESAVVCWGISRSDKKMYFRDCDSKKMYPDELYTVALDMVLNMGAFILAVEVTSLEQFIVQPIKNEMRIRGVTAQFMELKGSNAAQAKPKRVATLAPHYRHGYVYHNKAICGKLESQLLSFPRSKFWDVMDAAAYITKIMEMEQQYFDPEGFDADVNPEDEFKELDNDEILEYERVA